MFDIRLIREVPEDFDRGLARRGLAPQAESLIAVDEARRAAMTAVQEAQAERNEASKAIGKAKAAGEDASAIIAKVGALKGKIQEGEDEVRRLTEQLDSVLAEIPNLPDASVPDGADEDENVELRRVGEQPEFSFEAREHFDVGEALGGLDFERAAKLSGSRFVVLTGQVARLERAIGQFMIDLQTLEHGYTEVAPPTLVRSDAVFGTGQLPKFADDLFKTTTDHWLVPTAEVSLTNLHAGEILDAEDLPIRLTALTPCFRSEAGAAGRDTRGMIRQHQFNKVELVSITEPDKSAEELDRMTGCAEQVLKRLELPYRVVALCTGDLGFAAEKTYDIEVWLAGQGRYREISSCSNCGAFQARRMRMRTRARGEKATRFPHTLNGSGLAVGRALVAVLETYQQADGSVTVPDVLRSYMGGLETITPESGAR